MTKDDAKSLAIAYASYICAKDDLEIIVWGENLLEMQDKLGVSMFEKSNTRALIEAARDRRKKD